MKTEHRPHAKGELPAPSTYANAASVERGRGTGARAGRQQSVGRQRCRMHGGALGSGGPSGKLNGRYRHG